MTTAPEALVSITRYAVSVLPGDDINRKYFTLFVELGRNGWTVHDGHGSYGLDGEFEPGRLNAHALADHEEALTLARKLAPGVAVNGRTATEAYRRTYGTEAAS